MDRNRAKRRLRAALRDVSQLPRADLVLIARPSSVDCDFAELTREVTGLIKAVRDEAGPGAIS